MFCMHLFHFAFAATNSSEDEGEGLLYIGIRAPVKLSILPPPSRNASVSSSRGRSFSLQFPCISPTTAGDHCSLAAWIFRGFLPLAKLPVFKREILTGEKSNVHTISSTLSQTLPMSCPSIPSQHPTSFLSGVGTGVLVPIAWCLQAWEFRFVFTQAHRLSAVPLKTKRMEQVLGGKQKTWKIYFIAPV